MCYYKSNTEKSEHTLEDEQHYSHAFMEHPVSNSYHKFKIAAFKDDKDKKIEDQFFEKDEYEEIELIKVLRSQDYYLIVVKIKLCYVFVKKTISEIQNLLQGKDMDNVLLKCDTIVSVVKKQSARKSINKQFGLKKMTLLRLF